MSSLRNWQGKWRDSTDGRKEPQSSSLSQTAENPPTTATPANKGKVKLIKRLLAGSEGRKTGSSGTTADEPKATPAVEPGDRGTYQPLSNDHFETLAPEGTQNSAYVSNLWRSNASLGRLPQNGQVPRRTGPPVFRYPTDSVYIPPHDVQHGHATFQQPESSKVTKLIEIYELDGQDCKGHRSGENRGQRSERLTNSGRSHSADQRARIEAMERQRTTIHLINMSLSLCELLLHCESLESSTQKCLETMIRLSTLYYSAESNSKSEHDRPSKIKENEERQLERAQRAFDTATTEEDQAISMFKNLEQDKQLCELDYEKHHHHRSHIDVDTIEDLATRAGHSHPHQTAQRYKQVVSSIKDHSRLIAHTVGHHQATAGPLKFRGLDQESLKDALKSRMDKLGMKPIAEDLPLPRVWRHLISHPEEVWKHVDGMFVEHMDGEQCQFLYNNVERRSEHIRSYGKKPMVS